MKLSGISVAGYGILAMGLLLSSISVSASENEKRDREIMNHCTMIMRFGISFSELMTGGMEKNKAWHEAADRIAVRYKIADVSRLKTITGVYATFIGLIDKFNSNTTGYFVLAHCLATHAQNKMLPLDSKEGIKSVNNALQHCQATAKDEDSLGGCVLTALRPLAIPGPTR
ncbi:MAG: hypothetical protein OEZ39_19450 [Gammaproteobacteria bacterium]|nr:hypothetical protein [Gammaproteobacteria bacterium]MDH5654042.1 hypothetical protein [Gammaproteobacteria bacterium]